MKKLVCDSCGQDISAADFSIVGELRVQRLKYFWVGWRRVDLCLLCFKGLKTIQERITK